MVCEKCEKKLNRVICPEVTKKPMHKVGSAAAAEEKKEECKWTRVTPTWRRETLDNLSLLNLTQFLLIAKVPLYKRRQQAAANSASDILDFANITTQSLTESSLIGSSGTKQASSAA